MGNGKTCRNSLLQPSTPPFFAQACLMQSWYRFPAIRLSLSSRLKYFTFTRTRIDMRKGLTVGVEDLEALGIFSTVHGAGLCGY